MRFLVKTAMRGMPDAPKLGSYGPRSDSSPALEPFGGILRCLEQPEEASLMKRSRKVVPIKARAGGGMTGRDGAIDFSAKAALVSREARQSG